ncbi:MAG: SAM-dependent DNA methyltransferase, partial [Clostridium sp.]|nr:SAM-dependent DNA methyltransferase [Clostridium sp.]
MKPLSKELRNKFERTIENAREIAEEAAKIALEQLGVGEASPYSYLSEDERALRRRLRAHGRNLGDIRDSKTETQEIDRLVEEIAYEHWHRMLFARFLAENDLLMYYEDNDIENAVPVTLSECDELAEELGLKNGWEMAAKLATKMLPQIFKINSPIFEIQFSPEYQRKLENVVSSISKEVFLATDSLGWVYQYWQSRQKETINKSGVKIGSQELPAVTQLFTEDYMVQFLLDNTIGAWWATHLLSNEFVKKARTEQELRTSAAFSNVQLDYLRFVKDENGQWEVGSKSGYNWPDDLTSFKMID